MPNDPAKKQPSVMRGLGLLTGDLWSALTGKARKPPEKKVLRHEVQEQTRDTPDGKVVLRRTTIEEVEIRQNPSEGT